MLQKLPFVLDRFVSNLIIQLERVDSLGIGCDRHRPQLKPAVGADSKARASLKFILGKGNDSVRL